MDSPISTEMVKISGKKKIILFANPLSGSNQAKKYLQLYSKALAFDVENSSVKLYIYELTSDKGRREGTQKIASLMSKTDEKIRVVVAGGDGSLIWIIEELLKSEIDIKKVDLGILPFGTGNDLSCMLGWGRSPMSHLIGNSLEGLKNSIQTWMEATPQNLDIWNIEIDVEENGYFQKISKHVHGFERKNITDDNGNISKSYQRLMTNYFSMGLDARIGLGFDKRRSKKKCFNKCIYVWEGFKKMCCLRVPKLKTMVNSFIETENNVIFDNSAPGETNLPRNTSVFLMLNSRTYAGQDHYVWDKAKAKKNSTYQPQNPRDGLLESMYFRGNFDLGLEQVPGLGGRATKLHQGAGPFVINFAPMDDEEEVRVYMQIDGEYFYAVRPKQARVSLSNISKEGVSILVRHKK